MRRVRVRAQGVNLRLLDDNHITISLDETTSIADVDHLLSVLNGGKAAGFSAESLAESVGHSPSGRHPQLRCAVPCQSHDTGQLACFENLWCCSTTGSAGAACGRLVTQWILQETHGTRECFNGLLRNAVLQVIG